ncbi:hypothetical protein D9Q98_007455 [Chlorella vulgaris]|uniref:G8 domain-containing protein n=1 Tax=Chlorella vulgaris TaxID=3077 RepID=A0A9D4TLK4_CHLVU|nr:hypothetical protein D9Q98_007455 [Chlorella vulgaris]
MQPSNTIVLPSASKVLLGACMLQQGATYRQIVVPAGSELIFADEDMALDVGSIIVSGAMRAGGPTCRLASRLTLAFHALPGINPIDMALRVTPGGTLDLHGKLFEPTWTRLAQTATAGSSTLQLQDAALGWEPGQQAMVATTIWKDEQENQNEVVTVASVSEDGRTIFLTAPLQYQHYGGPEYQAEVGLLSRYILIQGDEAAAASRKGPHVRVEGWAQIRGVQAYRAGQFNVIGAYPFHWHMVGDASGQLATDNSVYRSFFRCFTVHATSNLLLQHNVAFDATGHCFYLEDGVEELNTVDHNLAAYVHVIGQAGQTFGATSDRAQPADAAASGFYVTNPNNRLSNNAASGGYAGFTYPVLPKPIGLSRDVDIVPASRPLLLFDSNTAHSSGYMWEMAGCLYFGGTVYETQGRDRRVMYNNGRHEFPTTDAAGETEAFFRVTNSKLFLCMVGHMSWGQRFEVINYQAFDIVRGATLFGQGLLQHAYINVQSGNQLSQFPGRLDDLPPIAGFQWYDTRTQTIIKDTTFANYKWQPQLGTNRMSVFYSMTHSDEFKPMGMSSTSNITLLNVDHSAIARVDVRQTGSSRMFNWLDYDGSATQRPTPSIVGSWPDWWNLDAGCTYEGEWNAWVCPWREDQEVARLELRIPGLTKAPSTGSAVPPTPANTIGFVALFGYDQQGQARTMDITRNEGITGVTGNTGWYVHMPAGAPKYHELWLSQLPVGTHIIYATRFPPGTRFEISRVFKWFKSLNRGLRQAASLGEVVSGDGLSYYFNGRHLFIKLVDPGNSETQNIDFCRDSVCVRGSRYFSLAYTIRATTLACSTSLCPVPSQVDIPATLPGITAVRTPPVVVGTSQPTIPVPAPAVPSLLPGPAPAVPVNPGSPTESSAPDAAISPPDCPDKQPTDGSSCAQKKKWGQCGASWLMKAGWCSATCGRCGQAAPQPRAATFDSCFDRQPPGASSCAQQKAWGKCKKSWVKRGGYCAATCGRCQPGQPCTDKRPRGSFTCAQQKAWGKCSQSWMAAGDYCAATCGTCTAAVAAAAVAGPAAGPGAGPPTDDSPTRAACEGTATVDGVQCSQSQADEEWAPEACTDIPTLDGVSCMDQRASGACDSPYLKLGNYCDQTCGRCLGVSAGAPAAPLLEAAAPAGGGPAGGSMPYGL